MNYAIILASGAGKRAGCDLPKQFITVNGKTILEHTISVFEKNKNTDRIILVVCKDYLEFAQKLNYKKLYKVVEGGKRRQDSSKIGVDLIEEDNSKVLIHDGARPYVTDRIINDCYEALDKFDAVNTGIESSDTIMEINENRTIKRVPERKMILRCQTPQGFKTGLIKKAHKIAKEQNLEVTDDAGLVVALGLGEVFVIEGDVNNIKVTYPDDIEAAFKKL